MRRVVWKGWIGLSSVVPRDRGRTVTLAGRIPPFHCETCLPGAYVRVVQVVEQKVGASREGVAPTSVVGIWPIVSWSLCSARVWSRRLVTPFVTVLTLRLVSFVWLWVYLSFVSCACFVSIRVFRHSPLPHSGIFIFSSASFHISFSPKTSY